MDEEWYLTKRVVHSKGGVRLTSFNGPQVAIFPPTTDIKILSFQLGHYGDLFNISEDLGLPTLGTEFFTSPDQFTGRDIPEWRSYSDSTHSPWVNHDGARLWRKISHGARQNNNVKLWDICNRISHQLRACSWKLKELSDSYNRQLVSILDVQDFTKNTKFMNGYTIQCYSAIQDFLVEACILRDYLAEYAACFALNNVSKKTVLMSKLILQIKNNEDSLAKNIIKITNKNGWLKKLSSYRNLIVHSAPFVHAGKSLFATASTINIKSTCLPQISCPIPRNPCEIKHSRTTGSIFKNFHDGFGINEDDTQNIDGLQYCHEVLNLISNFANELALRSPVQPIELIINRSDIIGKVKFTPF